MPQITEHVARSERHTTFYLAAGPADGPLVVLVHGWPELSISWRHQLQCLGALGFRAVAPDMRGYGRSSVYAAHEDYALQHSVTDMLELLDALGAEQAVWVGHDWGSPVVWSLAAHHPGRCRAVANLCVPYATIERGLDHLVGLVDRGVYPADAYPYGQWSYMRFYEERFAEATAAFEADPERTVRALFRSAAPEKLGRPSGTSKVLRDGGWFGGSGVVPDVPRDDAILSESELRAYAAALERNGFSGPDSWYMNHTANAAYSATAADGGRLAMPVLFLHARHDPTCETVQSRLAEPMRALCPDLTEHILETAHWMAQERPTEVNAALAGWLARSVGDVWPLNAPQASTSPAAR